MTIMRLKGKRFVKCPHCMRKFVLKLSVEKGEVSEKWDIRADGVQLTNEITDIELLDEFQRVLESQRDLIKVLEEKIEELDMSLEAMTDY